MSGIFNLPDPQRSYSVDMALGLVRAFFLFQIAVLVLLAVEKGSLTKKTAFVLILAFTAGDLVVFNARFNDITAPFYYKEAFYPKGLTYKDIDPGLKQQLDLMNFRVSRQNAVDLTANKNLIFAVPSYTGTVGYMTSRFSKLLTAFGYPQGIYLLYPEDATDHDRFLDISAVKYIFKEKGGWIERPTALERLNVVYASEGIPDDNAALARLTSEGFDPHRSVILSSPASQDGNRKSDLVKIERSEPDLVEAGFKTDRPRYLLFNESFDEGWQAYLNNKRVPVTRANYNFMACEIPAAGTHQIRFIFSPASYTRNLFLSLLGVLILAVAALWGAARAGKRRR